MSLVVGAGTPSNTDIGLGSRSGIDAARTIRAARPETRVLFVTMYDDETTVLRALQSGGNGYVLKGAADDELIRAIQAVHASDHSREMICDARG